MSGSGLRVLVCAASTRLGGLVVDALERAPEVEAIVAVDDRPPAAPFFSAEFVRLGGDHAQLPRIVRAAGVDVLVDMRAAAAVARLDLQALSSHAAASARIVESCLQTESPVRRLVGVGSVHRYGWHRDLPAFVGERTAPAPSAGPLRTALAEIETAARDAGARDPTLRLTLVRLADPVGPAGAGLLGAADRLPLMPTVLGFDPPVQVVHEDDAARAVGHVVTRGLDGPRIVAADGTLALSEALDELRRRHAPLLPPWGIGLIAATLQRAGVRTAVDLAGQLRHGRGLDNRGLKQTGFRYRATTREALREAAEVRRRIPAIEPGEPVPYDADVEAFLRYSSVTRDPATSRAGGPPTGIAALEVEPLLALLPSLDAAVLRRLRDHETAGPARRRVLDEIDLLLTT